MFESGKIPLSDAFPEPYSEEWAKSLQAILGPALSHQLGIFALPSNLTLSVVVPVYNEEGTVREIVSRICRVCIRKQIVLVDDGSSDGSFQILKMLPEQFNDKWNELLIVGLPVNRGKGAAVRTGFAHASGDIVLVQDADTEYDPMEYPRLIWPIVNNEADVVFGSRFLGDHPHRVLYYSHYVANKLLTALSNCTTNLNLTDMETCYKVFRRESLQQLLPKLRQERFGFEPEVTARIAQSQLRVYEVAIGYHGRTYQEGKKIGLKDAFNALWCILRYGLFR